MADESQNGSGDESDTKSLADLPIVERRRMMKALGAGAFAGLAGCGGDSGTPTATDTPTDTATPTDTPGDGMTATPTPTDTPTDTPGGGTGGEESPTDTESPTVTMKRYVPDPIQKETRPGPAPTEAQYQPFATVGTSPNFAGMFRYNFVVRSQIDFDTYNEMVKEYTYRPGVLDVTLHDDFFYWDGDSLDADNVLKNYELQDFQDPEELDAHPNIVEYEKLDDYKFRFKLIDTWSEPWAVYQTLENTNVFPGGSMKYFQSWLEKFRDASSQSKLEDLRTQLDNAAEHDPAPFYYTSFEIVEGTPNKWILKLRTRDHLDSKGLDHEVPHFAKEVNYTDWEILWTGQTSVKDQIMFANGEKFWGGSPTVSQGDSGEEQRVPFETTSYPVLRPSGAWGWVFNCSRPATNSARFRRAWAYIQNRERIAGSNYSRTIQPFRNQQYLDAWVSDDVVDAFEDYGPKKTMKEKAEQEMIGGGFVRNSDGKWLYREGDNAGKPISFDFFSFGWMSWLTTKVEAFEKNMKDFGIDVEYESPNSYDGGLQYRGWVAVGEPGNFEAAMVYYGGPTATICLDYAFGDPDQIGSAGGSGNPQLPETVQAPPVGETNNWADAKDWPVRAMNDRLKFIQDLNKRQVLIDQLSWVHNQIVPKYSAVNPGANNMYINDRMWDLKDPQENPELFSTLPWRRVWQNGALSYTPPEERETATQTSTDS